MSIKSILKANKVTAIILLIVLIIRHDIRSHLNLYKTVRLNFKYFPIKTAIKFPILVFGKLELLHLKGSIVIEGNIRSRMIKIGYNSDQFVASNTCGLWDMHGEIRFRGKALFSPGVTINVSEDARLIIGNCVSLGAKVKVRSWHSIIIDDFTGIAEESQLFDTDFHLIRELNSGKVYNHCGEIYIGKTCWIGNRCTIAKGTRLPERTIVASNSLANRDYFTLLTKPSVIGGIPAKILRENIVRIYDSAVEEQVLTFFKNTPDSVSMNEVQRFMSLHEENTQIQHYFDSVI